MGPSPPSPTVARRWQRSHQRSRAGGRWEEWQERQPPKPTVVQLGAQAASMKMPAARVFVVQDSWAAETNPEGLNLQLTQTTVIIMQPLQLQASSAHHIWVWLGPAGAAQEVWQQSRTTTGCSKREPWCPAGLCLGTGGRKRGRRGSRWPAAGPG